MHFVIILASVNGFGKTPHVLEGKKKEKAKTMDIGQSM